jgi:hypothetical protein
VAYVALGNDKAALAEYRLLNTLYPALATEFFNRFINK